MILYLVNAWGFGFVFFLPIEYFFISSPNARSRMSMTVIQDLIQYEQAYSVAICLLNQFSLKLKQKKPLDIYSILSQTGNLRN